MLLRRGTVKSSAKVFMRKFLILLILVATPLSAEWHRAKLFGADVRALIIDSSELDTLYLGTSGGEVYVSHDGARTWANPRISVEVPGHLVDNLVIDRDGRLWRRFLATR